MMDGQKTRLTAILVKALERKRERENVRVFVCVCVKPQNLEL